MIWINSALWLGYCVPFLLALLGAGLVTLVINRLQRFLLGVPSERRVIAFFHPYCDGGGGGERVVWVAIEALLRANRSSQTNSVRKGFANLGVAIYNGGKYKDINNLLKIINAQFHINLIDYADQIILVNIRSTTVLEAKWYPVATMLGQCLGSILVGLECVLRFIPDLYFDTTGAAFTYPVFAPFCKVACYVHYPIISSDMLQRVREHRPAHNNNARIAQNVTISNLKVVYYKIIALLYSLVGSLVSVALVNSSWTEAHIVQLWSFTQRKNIVKVYPPCNTKVLQKQSPHAKKNQQIILSIGQFRPEKDHSLQLRAFSALLKLHPALRLTARLVIMGGARHSQDEKLVSILKSEAENLGIAELVEFVVNAPFEVLQSGLSKASIGIHSMWNEHFGISIVEMMAAGLLVVAHNSGGPKMDIIVPSAPDPGAVGFLAATVDEYAMCFANGLDMSEVEAREIRERAQSFVLTKFSDEAFSAAIVNAVLEHFN